jgi:hypothetical protein
VDKAHQIKRTIFYVDIRRCLQNLPGPQNVQLRSYPTKKRVQFCVVPSPVFIVIVKQRSPIRDSRLNRPIVLANRRCPYCGKELTGRFFIGLPITKHREGADFGLVASSRSIAPCAPTGGTACTNRSWKWCRIGNCACGHQQRTGISRRRFESIHQPYVGRGCTNGTGTLASSVFSANQLLLKS